MDGGTGSGPDGRWRVAVVGAGAAGLCAARHLAARPGVFAPPTVFEAGARLGGTWAYEEGAPAPPGAPPRAALYRGLRTNLPKEAMAFPDVPFAEPPPSFLPHGAVLAYWSATPPPPASSGTSGEPPHGAAPRRGPRPCSPAPRRGPTAPRPHSVAPRCGPTARPMAPCPTAWTPAPQPSPTAWPHSTASSPTARPHTKAPVPWPRSPAHSVAT
ncbi:uncharacterized protein LOC134153099 [Rhea pennata]|uniref:uncharacterized protein LOC134153099 n=1 Tax=Rhea pennata TaxID=8795 RepID=UPI002E26ABEF